mmetsp:Transcript_1764/g.5364  ORF Transcript_1764/g.5364 Transcript_1764/m.5364 type:complete len:96 (+) Transcript_1764:330-617(+)
MWTHTHPKPRVSLDTERKRRRTTSSPRPYTSVHARRKHANRAGGKETPVGESCEHVTKTNDRAAIGREMWFSFFYIDDNQLGSPFGMIPYGFNAK